jgi:hypothetical protein
MSNKRTEQSNAAMALTATEVKIIVLSLGIENDQYTDDEIVRLLRVDFQRVNNAKNKAVSILGGFR